MYFIVNNTVVDECAIFTDFCSLVQSVCVGYL